MSEGDRWVGILGNIVKAVELILRIKTLLWPTLLAAAMVVIGWFVGLRNSINPFYLLVGCALLAVCAVWIMVGIRSWLRVRSHQVQTQASAARPLAPGLQFLGRTTDERAVLAIGTRIVELDANAYEYFAGRDDNEWQRISRTIAVGQRALFSEPMLRAIVLGNRLPDEDVYIEHGARARFWTRSEVAENEAAAKQNGWAWRWYLGDINVRRARLVVVQASGLINEAGTFLREILKVQTGVATYTANTIGAGRIEQWLELEKKFEEMREKVEWQFV